MQKVKLAENIEFMLFRLEESSEAETMAIETGGVVYSWQTSDEQNWLRRGFSAVDVLGLVILPADLPAIIPLPDDDLIL